VTVILNLARAHATSFADAELGEDPAQQVTADSAGCAGLSSPANIAPRPEASICSAASRCRASSSGNRYAAAWQGTALTLHGIVVSGMLEHAVTQPFH